MSEPAPGAALGNVRARLQRIGDFFAKQRHLIAVRDGVVSALPLVITGSLFLIIAQLPGLEQPLKPYVPLLIVPYRALGGVIAIYVTFAAAYSLSRSYSLDMLASGLLALAAYVLAALPGPVSPPPAVPVPPGLPLSRLGAGGIFAGLAIAITTVELQRFFVQRRLTIRMPASAPEVVIRSFAALVPSVVVLTLTFLLVHVAQVDLISLLERLSAPLVSAAETLPAALAVAGIDSGMWLLGVHASAVTATLRPMWEVMLMENQSAVGQGLTLLPHIAPQEFYLWFVWQGGSGGTLALALLLFRARSAQLRNLGKVSWVPALFNVNEPLVFGVPIVLNPMLVVPFVLAPALCVITTYVSFRYNWVMRPFGQVPWTAPAPIGAFLSTRDPRAVVLQMFNLAMSMLVYWPFVRRYDRRLLGQEQARSAELPIATQSP